MAEETSALIQELQEAHARIKKGEEMLTDAGPELKALHAVIEGASKRLLLTASIRPLPAEFYNALEKITRIAAYLPGMMEFATEVSNLTPYLTEELKKPDYEGKTLDEFIQEGKWILNEDPLFLQALTAARKAKAAEESKTNYRTAKTAGNIEKINFDRLAITTAVDLINAVSLNENGLAFMRNVEMDGLRFKDGKLYFTNDEANENDFARAITEVELKNLQTKEDIQSINLPFLQFYYTHLFHEWEESIQEQARGGNGTINQITTFYLPDLAAARGLPKNAGKDSINAIQNDIAAFHNIVGVLKVEGYKQPSYYPVLNFEGYNAKNNTISISSPYLLHVVEKIYKVSVRRKKDGTKLLRNDGTPQTLPVNSYMVHSDIMKERNKAAVQNVFIIVQGLERCGENEYSISAETLIDRNPILQQQLESNQNKNRLLKRVFEKTWELLRNKTDLIEKYRNIKLPDPTNPADIPTPATMKKFVIVITHDGKKK